MTILLELSSVRASCLILPAFPFGVGGDFNGEAKLSALGGGDAGVGFPFTRIGGSVACDG